METTHITYAGADLEVLTPLADLWPYDMPLEDWPTYCGPGSSLGDFMVPDTIECVSIAPACLNHDLEFMWGPRTVEGFLGANTRLRKNMESLFMATIVGDSSLRRAINIADMYWHGVNNSIAWELFEPVDTPSMYDAPGVKEKLHRLAYASLSIPWVGGE